MKIPSTVVGIEFEIPTVKMEDVVTWLKTVSIKISINAKEVEFVPKKEG